MFFGPLSLFIEEAYAKDCVKLRESAMGIGVETSPFRGRLPIERTGHYQDEIVNLRQKSLFEFTLQCEQHE